MAARKTYSTKSTRSPAIITGSSAYQGAGMHYQRAFSQSGKDPLYLSPIGEKVEWDEREAIITDDAGKEIFKQKGVRVPSTWSPLAAKVVSSKYFYGDAAKGDRESSVADITERVADKISSFGFANGYFASQSDAQRFRDDLVALTTHQYMAFNSPVWFNVGVDDGYKKRTGKTLVSGSEGHFRYDLKKDTVVPVPAGQVYQFPQGSACFIQRVDDNMDSILKLAYKEGMLFKQGSGTGSDLSTLRSTREKLTGGGKPSGPLSFLRIYDQIAGVVKSGGKTRRAAKMNSLQVWHPDIKEFIEVKANEERKARALIAQGYSSDFNGEAYASIAFQNENLSVRVTDDFMRAVKEDKDWATHWVTNPAKSGPVYKARDIMNWIAEGTWFSGDPGVQYHDTINKWHTCKNTGDIRASNPCSEYMFLDDSACNLASLNLMKFRKSDGTFDTKRFTDAVRTTILGQEIIVDMASYPSELIAQNSHDYRPLGLGYANLGALIMSYGLPYDSEEGRALAGSVTALMNGAAYNMSAEIAAARGAFPGFKKNKEPTLEVVLMHEKALQGIDAEKIRDKNRSIYDAAKRQYAEALVKGEKHGFKNAQQTVLAPTGTIAFMMDCDTTGIEPETALVKYKLLAGGGNLKIVNRMVPMSLRELGYSDSEISKITEHIDKTDTIEGAPGLKDAHLPIFDCSFKPKQGERFIQYTGHMKMMAAAQPFLSGAISKTVNMPESATVEEIAATYIQGHELGLKAVAIYRDNCKASQPLTTSKRDGEKIELKSASLEDKVALTPMRRRLPQHRLSVTSKYKIAGEHELYITTGLHDDGAIGETFVTMQKEGSFVSGMMDLASTFLSVALQYSVPLEVLISHMKGTSFEPAGFIEQRKDGLLSELISPIEGRVNSVADLWGKHLENVQSAMKSKKILSNYSGNGNNLIEDKKDTPEKKKNEWIHTCKYCGAIAKDTDNKCGRICQNGHVDQSGCSG